MCAIKFIHFKVEEYKNNLKVENQILQEKYIKIQK